MDKRVATNIIKMLDDVSIKGHSAREIMNEACEQLLEIVNSIHTKEKHGKTNTK